jgi:hypothetical protein
MENLNINPWIHLWTHPRKTLRSILNTDPRGVVVWIAIISGIIGAFAYSLRNNFITDPPKWASLLIIFIVGIVSGVINLYFSAWLLSITGQWIGGRGNFTQVKCAVGWGYYPFIVFNVLLTAGLVTKIFWLKVLLIVLALFILVWALIIIFQLIGEAHLFSAWKGVLAYLIATVLVLVAFIIVALLIPLISPLFSLINYLF